MVPEPIYVANGDTFQSKSTGGTQNGSQCTICPTITGGTGAFANATVDGPELRLYWCRYKHCRFFPNRWRRESPAATGAAAPGSPLGKVSNAITVTTGGQPATVLFAGLAPACRS